ncbi:adenylate/guanylate cyclase domain-containing protein [Sorangium sp. So ce1036]|uniref:adenylate/guanylate cyclase domain-containing protein n=1 Tax=Sorangium sp. So ce1036 TaxID=3133328 RepID=UPI003F0C3AD2
MRAPADAMQTRGGPGHLGAPVREFCRDFFTDTGARRAPRQRLHASAWVRLLSAPLVLVPTGLVLSTYAARAPYPVHARRVIAAWLLLQSAYLVANAALLAVTRRGGRDASGIARALTYAVLTVELVTNQLAMHATGTLVSPSALYIVMFVAVYRVFFDFRLGRFAAVLGAVLYCGVGALELAHVIRPHPLFSSPVPHLFYAEPAAAATLLATMSAGVFLVFFASNYAVNQAERLHRYLTESVLRRYLPPSLVERAAHGELRMDAEPERRVVTVMFTDLVGFTSLSETLGAEAVGRLLNRYLSMMADVAHAHGATVDKFVGDAVMIVFGAPDPLDPAEQARRCVALAQDLQAALPLLGGDVRLVARAGINTGEAVVGNFGSLSRSDYTVIGPAVNVAARLETASEPGRILVGEATARLLDGAVPLEPACELRLKGVAAPVRAFFVR